MARYECETRARPPTAMRRGDNRTGRRPCALTATAAAEAYHRYQRPCYQWLFAAVRRGPPKESRIPGNDVQVDRSSSCSGLASVSISRLAVAPSLYRFWDDATRVHRRHECGRHRFHRRYRRSRRQLYVVVENGCLAGALVRHSGRSGVDQQRPIAGLGRAQRGVGARGRVLGQPARRPHDRLGQRAVDLAPRSFVMSMFFVSEGYGQVLLGRIRQVQQKSLHQPVEFPLTLGRDFAGEVVATGVNVTKDLKVGDTVVGVVPPFHQGCHAEFVSVPDSLVRHPMSFHLYCICFRSNTSSFPIAF